MKRQIGLLADYSSSEEEEHDEQKIVATKPEPPAKRKKLPALSESISGPIHKDDPALHQGRIRTTPHVEGQFAAHVYVSLSLKGNPTLYKLLKEVLRDAKELVPTLHELVAFDTGYSDLHVSLSRPVFLRAHQREEFKRSVRNIAKEQSPFAISFAAFSELTNDEKTRTFLVLEVGAGHHNLRTLASSLTSVMKSFRQKEYYESPRFHASIGWALLDIPSPLDHERKSAARTASPLDFPTIPRFPNTLLPFLEEKYHKALTSGKVAVFHVDQVTVKIGKEISCWQLSGSSTLH
ncbi:hypothetical protein CC2G_012951 [Coprinopsis cinerea AmutBmut pab1-1]|nr:hypothetical protein CC2G_012951 [Coprinopsis cinerea AmutBmut pab1-1]